MDKRKILIVDDHAIIRQGAALTLETLGFKVDQAASGDHAVQLFEPGQYAAILMDYQMPGMNGFECTAQIRQIESQSGAPRVPIICISAFAKEDMKTVCLEAGLDDYIPKDWSTDELKGVLDKHLGRLRDS